MNSITINSNSLSKEKELELKERLFQTLKDAIRGGKHRNNGNGLIHWGENYIGVSLLENGKLYSINFYLSEVSLIEFEEL